MVSDGDQSTGSGTRKAVPRSLSPDSPLPQVPVTSAVPCGGSVELQRLRSHVLPLDALGSSGSSSDEDRDMTVQTVAPLPQAATPQQHMVPDRELEAKPPLIRHGGGALAGLLDGPEEGISAPEAAAATAERFRRATGSPHKPAAAGDAADGAHRSAQSLPFASGKKRVGGPGAVSKLLTGGMQARQQWSSSSALEQAMTDGVELVQRQVSDPDVMSVPSRGRTCCVDLGCRPGHCVQLQITCVCRRV